MTLHQTILPEDIPEKELREEFLCTASGPGGQHVNRTASTARLLFDAENSILLTPTARMRLKKLAPQDESGFIVITCRETRSLARNRARAREILAEWINQARIEPRKRKKTKPTRAAREKRLQEKARRSRLKAVRAGKYE